MTIEAVWTLPENHIYRLIFRVIEDDSRIDWDLVLNRLESAKGRLETRQWVKTDYCTSRLFLHELCEVDFPQLEQEEDSFRRMEIYITVLKKCLEVYPEALELADGHAYWPLHILCRQSKFFGDGIQCPRVWSCTATRAFRLILRASPKLSTWIVPTDERTALHCLLDSIPRAHTHMDCVVELLDHFPLALQLPNRDGNYPLHVASSKCSLETIKLLVRKWPQAAEIPGARHQTPILSLIRMVGSTSFELVKFLIQSCPQSVSMGDDHSHLKITFLTRDLEPAGDVLDYLICKYCELVRVPFSKFADPLRDAQNPILSPLYSGDFRSYIPANAFFLNQHLAQLPETSRLRMKHVRETLDLILLTLRIMYGRSDFFPLHAFVQGRQCRPWHLVLFQEFVCRRFPKQTLVRDADDNLPLHLFLEYCRIEQDRALEQYYASDVEEYNAAIYYCLQLLLQVSGPQVLLERNREGRLPIHLALESRCGSFIILELLKQTPANVLMIPDPRNKLLPFCTAAVGAQADLNLTFLLLQNEPRATFLYQHVPE